MTVYRLKPKEQMAVPDPWWEPVVTLDPDGIRRWNMDDHYAAINAYELQASVPEKVQQAFETARNLYLYSFFVHQFLMVSELHVGISVEFALREKANLQAIPVGEHWGMKRLIELAIKQRWIVDSGFERFRKQEEHRKHNEEMWPDMFEAMSPSAKNDPQRYCKLVAEIFPVTRNTLAHGSAMFYHTVLGSFALASDLINQVFISDSTATR